MTRSVVAASLVLACCADAGPAHAEAPQRLLMVAVDVRAVDDAAFKRFGVLELTRKITLRLTQSGFAAVAPRRRPHVRVTLRRDGARGLTLRAEARRVAAATRSLERGRERLEDFHLEVVHKAVAAVREVAARYRAMLAKLPRAQRGEGELPPQLRLSAGAAGRARGARWALYMGSILAPLYRGSGLDLQARLRFRYGAQGSGLSLHLSPAFSVPLRGADEGLSVFEWGLQAGAGWGFALGDRWRLELALLVGFSLHHFRLDTAGAGPASSSSSSPAVDLLATVSADLAFRLTERVWLGVWLAPGLAHRGRTHSLDIDRVLYERDAGRFEAGLLLRAQLTK